MTRRAIVTDVDHVTTIDGARGSIPSGGNFTVYGDGSLDARVVILALPE